MREPVDLTLCEGSPSRLETVCWLLLTLGRSIGKAVRKVEFYAK